MFYNSYGYLNVSVSMRRWLKNRCGVVPAPAASHNLLTRWGWDPLRTTETIWLKMPGDKIWTGAGKRLRDQHEAVLIAVRGTIPQALPMWGSVLVAPVGEHSEKPKLLMEMIDRYGPELTRIEMFVRPPFDRRGWWYWGDAVPGGLMYTP